MDTVAAQVAAIDELLQLARQHVQVFDRDLSEGGWERAERVERLGAFLRRSPAARLDVIVHDTRWLEQRAPRLLALMRLHAQAFRVYRTGPEAQAAMDPLVIVDARHFLHRYHVDHPRATLGISQPAATRPLAGRFDEIWATGEPGISGTVLGL